MEIAVVAARRSPRLHAGRRDRHRRARAGRGRRADPAGLPLGHRGPGVRPRAARAHGGGGRGADRQHAVRSLPSAAGVRRRAHHGAGVRPARRPQGRRGSATTTTSPGRSARSARCSVPTSRSPAHPGSSRRRPSWSGSRCSARRRPSTHWRAEDAVDGADAVHADTWVSMGQEDEKAARVQGVRGLHRRRRS